MLPSEKPFVIYNVACYRIYKLNILYILHVFSGGFMDVGYLLKQISDKLQAEVDNDFSIFGLTSSQTMVILILNVNGGTMKQRELEEKMHVSHPTVAGLVKRLVQKGFVKTSVDQTDRRNTIVSIGGDVSWILSTFHAKMRIQEDKMLKGLTEKQIADLKKSLSIILDNVLAGR